MTCDLLPAKLLRQLEANMRDGVNGTVTIHLGNGSVGAWEWAIKDKPEKSKAA